jgi:transcriptional/translational regulatory protein YebC/TACO1
MAKKSPVEMTVSINITASTLHDIADCTVDYLYDRYGDTVVEAAGVDKEELVTAVMRHPKFREKVTECVIDQGEEFLRDPWSYINYDEYLTNIPGIKELEKHLQWMAYEIEEAEASFETDFADIGQALAQAGYKIVKA